MQARWRRTPCSFGCNGRSSGRKPGLTRCAVTNPRLTLRTEAILEASGRKGRRRATNSRAGSALAFRSGVGLGTTVEFYSSPTWRHGRPPLPRQDVPALDVADFAFGQLVLFVAVVKQITPWHLVDSKRPYASGSSWRALRNQMGADMNIKLTARATSAATLPEGKTDIVLWDSYEGSVPQTRGACQRFLTERPAQTARRAYALGSAGSLTHHSSGSRLRVP